jgi:hypothetical protein
LLPVDVSRELVHQNDQSEPSIGFPSPVVVVPIPSFNQVLFKAPALVVYFFASKEPLLDLLALHIFVQILETKPKVVDLVDNLPVLGRDPECGVHHLPVVEIELFVAKGVEISFQVVVVEE